MPLTGLAVFSATKSPGVTNKGTAGHNLLQSQAFEMVTVLDFSKGIGDNIIASHPAGEPAFLSPAAPIHRVLLSRQFRPPAHGPALA